jgi:hypothetical protein
VVIVRGIPRSKTTVLVNIAHLPFYFCKMVKIEQRQETQHAGIAADVAPVRCSRAAPSDGPGAISPSAGVVL